MYAYASIYAHFRAPLMPPVASEAGSKLAGLLIPPISVQCGATAPTLQPPSFPSRCYYHARRSTLSPHRLPLMDTVEEGVAGATVMSPRDGGANFLVLCDAL